MTPYEFGRQVKIAAETGGLGEWMGQGFDNGVKRFNKAVGMPELSPQAWGGGGAMPAPAAAPSGAPRAPKVYKTVDQMAGPGAAAHMRPTPQPPKAYKTPDQMAGPSASAPAPAPAARPAPRPAAARPAPVQPKPTAPGVRKPGGRVA